MSRKTLDTTGIQNELEGASLHFQRRLAKKPKSAKSLKRAARGPKSSRERARKAQAVPPSGSSSGAAHVPKNVSQKQLTGRAVSRPVSFYLPEVIDAKIDDAVDYMGKQRGVKVDRSAVVSAILGDPLLWEPESLNGLVDRAVDQLTSRLAGRLTLRPTDRSTNGPTGRLNAPQEVRPEQPSRPENPPTEVEMRSVP